MLMLWFGHAFLGIILQRRVVALFITESSGVGAGDSCRRLHGRTGALAPSSREAVRNMWHQRYKDRDLAEVTEEAAMASQSRKDPRKYDTDDDMDHYLRNKLGLKN